MDYRLKNMNTFAYLQINRLNAFGECDVIFTKRENCGRMFSGKYKKDKEDCMRSEHIGMKYTHIAALAFGFSLILNDYLTWLFILGYIILYEKNQWLTRQVLSAVLLKAGFSVISLIANKVLAQITIIQLNQASKGLGDIFDMSRQFAEPLKGHWVFTIINLVWIVLICLSIYNVLHEKEAGIPLIQDLFKDK